MKELLMQRKARFAVYLIACCFFIVTHFAQNFSIAMVIGSIEVGTWEHFRNVLILISAVAVGSSLLFIASRFLRIRFMRDVLLDIRAKAFSTILDKPYKAFFKKSKDVYVSNLINDVNTIEKEFFVKLLNIIIVGAQYFISIAILLFMDPVFGGMIFTISAIIFLCTKVFEKRTVKLQEEVSEHNEEFTVDIANTFQGLEVLKLNSVEDKFLEKSTKAVDKVERKKLHYTVFTEGQRTFTNFMSLLAFMAILGYLLNLRFETGITLTRLAFMLQISNMCIWPMARMMPMINELKAANNIYSKITKSEDTNGNGHGSEEFKMEKGIELKDISFSYEGKDIIKNVNLNLQRGKKYLLKRASGAGKSTLLKLLSRVEQGYEGDILFDGIDLRSIKEQSFNDNISFIYQDVFLFEDTIKNNISLYKPYSIDRINQAVEESGLSDLIEEKGLDEMLLENGKNLSGGQRQRISIARAIIKGAPLLFVDECTSGLNEDLGASVEKTILSLDSTVIAISHRYYPGISEQYDYVLELKNGVINQYTTKEYFKEAVVA